MGDLNFRVEIWTDGACHPNPNGDGGWAAILVAVDVPSGKRLKEKVISGAQRGVTNNQMELLAVAKALSVIQKPCDVIIHTDSQYISNAFNQNWIKNWQKNGWITKAKEPVKNADLWKMILEHGKKHKITWNWVKGHQDDPENIRCDELAVAARKSLSKE